MDRGRSNDDRGSSWKVDGPIGVQLTTRVTHAQLLAASCAFLPALCPFLRLTALSEFEHTAEGSYYTHQGSWPWVPVQMVSGLLVRLLPLIATAEGPVCDLDD